jgi:ParB-like chromosome segregation protein Spo0J
VVFDGEGALEVVDGFKRLRAARRLGWSELAVRPCGPSLVDAKVGLVALHAACGLSELEEGWLVRSLYREHGMRQPEIGERLGRHKSWVCRRLMLVESLTVEVQASVRLGLVAPRAAVALAALPRGNQPAVSAVVVRRGLTVRQTEQLCAELLACTDDASRGGLLARWAEGATTTGIPGPRPTRAPRSEAQVIATDIETVRRVAARLEARLLGSPLRAHGPEAAELLGHSLRGLLPVLSALGQCIAAVTEPRARGTLLLQEHAP